MHHGVCRQDEVSLAYGKDYSYGHNSKKPRSMDGGGAHRHTINEEDFFEGEQGGTN